MSTAATLRPLYPLPSVEDEMEMLDALFGRKPYAELKGGALVATYEGQEGSGLFSSLASGMKKALSFGRRHAGNLLSNASDAIGKHAGTAVVLGADALANRLEKMHPLGAAASGLVREAGHRGSAAAEELGRHAAQSTARQIRGYGMRPF